MYVNKPYDEAYELSGESSAPETPSHKRPVKIMNAMYDEALEVSQSMDTRDGMLGFSMGSQISVCSPLVQPPEIKAFVILFMLG